jgi:molecular chaperone GrpE
VVSCTSVRLEFWNGEKKRTMTDSVPQEEEMVDDEAVAEGVDMDDASVDEVEASGRDTSPEPDASTEEVELEESKDDFEELSDRHLRLVAEFNNYRRRTEQERLGAWARAQADMVAKFLDVLDDLNRVAQLDLSNATVEAIMEGVDLVERKFIRVLEDSGVEVLDPVDAAFDPEVMEAMMRVPVDSEEQDDVVAQVFAKGYSLKGVLVRPARVSVYKLG